MPLSRAENVVARYPFLYIDVPRIMSFSVCPMTRRQNRTPTLDDTPVGRLFASGRWVASSRITPSARPRLMMAVHRSPASAPCSGCPNSSWHSSIATTSGYSPSERRAASCLVVLFSGQTSRGSPAMVAARRSSSLWTSRSAARHAAMVPSSTPEP